MKVLLLFSPSIVLLAWAGLVALGVNGAAVTVAGLLSLAVALAFHVHAEKERNHHAL